MTPLAMQIFKNKWLPKKQRENYSDPDGLRSFMEDCHFFDMTEVAGFIEEFHEKIGSMGDNSRDDLLKAITFLPAPRTWLEIFRGHVRVGLLLVEGKDEEATQRIGVHAGEIHVFHFTEHHCFPLLSMTPANRSFSVFDSIDETIEELAGWTTLVCCMLAAINTPRIIGRRQHMPHRGLERNLVKKFGTGRFPLHAWTEIKLEISKPTEIDDGEPHEAHLTGRRALHFCRAHLRIRNGKIEYVTSHWRGDAAIGIKQSRYTVC